MRLLIDCDGILSDFVGAFLKVANKMHMRRWEPYTREQVTTWEISESLGLDPDETKAVYDEVKKPGFCEHSIEPYADAVTGFDQIGIMKEIDEIFVVTAPMAGAPTWAHEREVWLAKHFEIPRKNVIHASTKHFIAGDIFVDDKPEHVIEWSEENPKGLGLLWRTPHNKRSTITDDFAVRSWVTLYGRIRRFYRDSRILERSASVK